MKKTKEQVIKFIVYFPYHPILISIYPVLALYSYNIRELTSEVLAKPLIVIILSTILLYLILDLLFKNFYKSSLILSLLSVIFFFHGHVHNLIGEKHVDLYFLYLGVDQSLYLFWITIVLVVIIFLIKTKYSLVKVTQILNVISIVLIAISLSGIVSFEISSKRDSSSNSKNSEETSGVSKSKISYKPDIYYLIFDRYTNNIALINYFKYDNSHFTDFLKSKGFVVDEKAKTNYPRTLLSLASSLNMKYINNYVNVSALKNNDETVLYPVIENHEVGKYLNDQGYTYHHLGSWFEPTKTNNTADINYQLQDVFLSYDPFTLKIIESTVLPPIIRTVRPDLSLSSFDVQHRNRINYQFDRLGELVKQDSPKFVFAHILLPHEPYVFDKSCKFIKAKESKNRKVEVVQYYTEQVQCANIKIKKLLTNILENSKNPPIIILQADEGSSNYTSILNQSKDEQKIEQYVKRFGILNALYLPNIPKKNIPKNLTPVNTFRFVFRSYFGENLKYLKNKYYYYNDPRKFLHFIDVTQLVEKLEVN